MSRKAQKPEAVALEVPRPAECKPQLRDLGGSNADAWNSSLSNYVARALPTSSDTFAKGSQDSEKIAALVAIADCKPADPLEGMLLAQIVSANATGLELSRRAWLKDQTFEARTKFLSLADRSARTVATLVEALNKHRGKGQQKMTVEHVHVHAGAQAIVGPVTHQGGNVARNEEQPHAGTLAYAPGAAMLGKVEAHGEAVPIASGARI